MKPCKDCRFFIVNGAVCGRSPKSPDYVNGVPGGNFSAQVVRMSFLAQDCGPEAKHFQPIPVAETA